MPTFYDPVADASEAADAMRGLAHASRNFEHPQDMYGVLGDLLANIRSLRQVLDQLATAHASTRSRAFDDHGNHQTGARDALAAADELHQAAIFIDQAEEHVNAGASAAARIAWHAESPAEPATVKRWVSICFLQGEDADEVLQLIDDEGIDAATGLGDGGVDGGGFWEGKTRVELQALLHAAALDNRSPAELFRWTLDPSAAADAVAILHASTRAATGWADSLEAMIEADPRTRDSIWQGVSLALAALADPRVLDAVSPTEDETFDPEVFIRNKGTLYLLATGAGAGNSAALVAALIEDLVETCRRIAARSPGARLDPPLLLALDEIGNLAPLPSLPTLMAEGGGTGITTMPVPQSLAQARDKWSDDQASAIWDASIVKIVLGGASNSRDLQDLSTLIGDRDEFTDSVSLGDSGSRTSQRSVRRVPILPPDRIRTIPFGTGVVLLRSAPPIIADLHPWPKRPDAKTLQRERSKIETLLLKPASDD